MMLGSREASTKTYRKHAAIMFTDIVGYTRLMREDEDKAFLVLKKNREIHIKALQEFNGQLVKEIGDGMLLSFDLASEAIKCALSIQHLAGHDSIPLKIGIHEGEVVFDSNDVWGDGVNIASRLQEKCQSGSILVSETVYRDVRNRSGISLNYLGERDLKNVDEPMATYEVLRGSHKGRIIRRRRRKGGRLSYVFSSILILGIGALLFFLFYRGTSIPFRERDWVLIADFENLTNDPVFDKSLNTAFRLSISQSRYINVVPRQQVRATLNRMQRDVTSFITEEIGREIALRDGIGIFMVPSISQVAGQYILTVKILEASSGIILKSEVIFVEAREEILNQLDRLCRITRRNLGESRFEIFSQDKPLADVTTSSLPALKQYSLGLEAHLNLQFETARRYYENAIGIDSTFIAAKASLGGLLFERFDRQAGQRWLESIIDSLDHLTDREKYGIQASFEANVRGDLQNAVNITLTRLKLYPDDAIAYNNLGWWYQQQGRYSEAASAYKRAVRINPDQMITLGGILWIYLEKIGDMDSALVWGQKMIGTRPENAWGYCNVGSAHAGLGHFDSAQYYFEKGDSIDPGHTLNRFRLAQVNRLQGEYDKAISLMEGMYEQDPNEVYALYNLGILYGLKGDTVQSKAYYNQFLDLVLKWEEHYPEYPNTFISIGLGYTRLGQFERGLRAGSRALELDSTFNFRYAELMACQGRSEDALLNLERALKNGHLDLAWIRLSPDLFPLHSNKKFETLLRKYFGPRTDSLLRS